MTRTIEEAKTLLESLKSMQDSESCDGYIFPCPRCGHKMSAKAVQNALSRRADVYICCECGKGEAIMDMMGMSPLPLNEWAMVLGFDNDDKDEGE